MKVSASIYANSGRNFTEMIQELEEHAIDMFHVDSNDKHEVFKDIEIIRQHSDKLVDLHIITDYPEAFFEEIEKYKPDFVTFQYENIKKKLELPKIEGVKFGLSIIADTPNEEIEEHIAAFDFILFMATIPGESGGEFDKRIFKKILNFQKKHPEKKVHVDGGVNGEVSFILRNMGVDVVVSGSYLFKFKKLGIAMLNIKANFIDSKYKLSDFMWGMDDIPVLEEKQADFLHILEKIENYKFGFCLITNEEGILQGIITNADVRKALIDKFSQLEQINLADLLNTNPVIVQESANVIELLSLVKKQSFPISVLPVVDSNKKLTGVVTFFNLIKGEL